MYSENERNSLDPIPSETTPHVADRLDSDAAGPVAALDLGPQTRDEPLQHVYQQLKSAYAELQSENNALRLTIATRESVIKQVEADLLGAEEQYRSVLSGLTEGVISYQCDGGVIDAWNSSAERILGISGDQLAGRTSLDPRWRAIREDGSPFPAENHPSTEVFRTGQAQSNVIMGVHKPDGSLIWILINALPIFRDADAVPARVVVSFSDITERKRVKDKLRLSDLALKAVSQGVLITDAEANILSANDAFGAISGYSPAEVKGRNCRFLQGRQTSMETVLKIGQSIRGKQHFSGEILNYRKDGSTFWNELTISPVSDAKGQLSHFIGITRDVTERKNASDKIRQLSLALEQSPEMVIITNTDAVIEYVNKVFIQSTGYQREEVIGKNPRMLGSGETPFKTYVALWEALTQGQAWKGRFCNRRKDGSGYIESAVITPLRQPDGRITHYVAVKQDITEQLRLEAEMDQYRFRLEEIVLQRTAELIAARKQAEVANNAKSRFLAATSHDLRQPLSALSLYVGVLKKNINQENDKLVGHIQDCVDSLSGLLTDLLDISKLDAQVITPEPSDFSIDELFSTLISVHAAEAELKGLRVRVRYSGCYARTDRGLMQRIAGNLLANAIQHTQKGGLLLTCRRHAGKNWIEVWDSGIGISEDKFDIIFEEFRQLGDDARTRGSGLGLSIVAKTAKLLGLEIRLHSRLGRGSMFAIELPPGRTVASSGLPSSEPEVRAVRIALVDDNVAVLQALALTLKSVGHEVVAAPTGKLLLEKLNNQAPDLVISDYRLATGETGFDVIASVRDAFGSGLPAFIITGDTDPALVRSMASHDIAVQYKPLQLGLLQTFIRKATERRKLS